MALADGASGRAGRRPRGRRRRPLARRSGAEGDGTVDPGGSTRGGDCQPWQTSGGGPGRRRPAGHRTDGATRPRTLARASESSRSAPISPTWPIGSSRSTCSTSSTRAGYLRAELDGVAERLGCAPEQVERVLARLQEFDPPGVFARDLPECLALQLRDRNRLDPAMQAAARQPAAARRAQRAGAAADLRGRRRGPRRDGGRDQVARPAAGHTLRPAAGPAGDPRHPHAGAAAGRLAGRAERRHPAAGAGQQPLFRPGQPRRAQQGRARIPDRPAAGGELAGQVAGPARHHDPQGRQRDRAPAGRVLPPRRAGAAALDPARHRRCDRHAREHGQPGHHATNTWRRRAASSS